MHAKLTTQVSFLTLFERPACEIIVTVLTTYFGFAIVASATDSTSSGGWHPVADIKAAAEAHVINAVGEGDNGRMIATAGHLDKRLQLPRCTTAIDPYIQNPGRNVGRMVVGVRCSGDKPWNVYLPVRVALMETVLVTARPLQQGHVLTREDLMAEQRDVSEVFGGFLSDADAAIGQRLKRSVGSGVVLTPAQVQPRILVERGQTVTLTVQGSSLNISMQGKALMDGAANQRIRVENVGSGRVVEGLVRSSQHVQVLVE
ncbi:MAG: flagellar basal body P-ring formation chaperone FlgA [Pseudomonadota bacterium]